MKLFKVETNVTASVNFLVAANTPEEAEEIVDSMDMDDFCDAGIDLISVDGTEVEEEERDDETGKYLSDPEEAVNIYDLTDEEEDDLKAGKEQTNENS